MGGNAENVLGMEWVTPEGEIVRTGSLGSGDGWFCSEGPGPSVRGICRGALGSRGGLGVYTKCAVKLGPQLRSQTEWKVEGTLPAYRLPVPRRSASTPSPCPRLGRLGGDLLRDLRQRDRLHLPPPVQPGRRRPRARLLAHVQRPHEDALRRARSSSRGPRFSELTEELRISFQLILAGRSKADIELQDKILDDILEEVGGHKVERFCEQDMAEFTNMYLQRLGHKHINFVWAGGYIGSWMQFGTPDWVKGYVPAAAAGLERDAAGGKLVQCGGDAMMGSGSGIPRRRRAWASSSSSATTPTTTSPRSPRIKHMEDAVKDAAAIGYPPGKEWHVPADRLERRAARAARSRLRRSRRSSASRRKIKAAFDPNDVGDRMYPTLPLHPGAGGADER